jgi:hypothetical protein
VAAEYNSTIFPLQLDLLRPFLAEHNGTRAGVGHSHASGFPRTATQISANGTTLAKSSWVFAPPGAEKFAWSFCGATMHPITCRACGHDFDSPALDRAGPGCPRCGEWIGPPGACSPAPGGEIYLIAALGGSFLGLITAALLIVMQN